MNIFISLVFCVLVIGSSGFHVYMSIKKKDTKVLYIQLGILAIVIIGGVFSIQLVPDPSIAKILGVVIPRIN